MPRIRCRYCQKLLEYRTIKDLPYFPFCSKRCKMADLGLWFEERHRIPGERISEEESPPPSEKQTEGGS